MLKDLTLARNLALDSDSMTPMGKIAKELYEEMIEQGNRCELVGYKGEGHGFFNYGRGGNGAFIDTVNKNGCLSGFSGGFEKTTGS